MGCWMAGSVTLHSAPLEHTFQSFKKFSQHTHTVEIDEAMTACPASLTLLCQVTCNQFSSWMHLLQDARCHLHRLCCSWNRHYVYFTAPFSL